MKRLILNDGSEFVDSSIVESDSILFVYIRSGDDLKSVFNCLINPDATKKIIYDWNGIETTYSGYTKLISVRYEGDHFVSASLKK